MARALPLVGRRRELALVTDALVAGSGPSALLLVGEAGVGKTRLVTEAIGHATAAGVTVLVGHCLPMSERVPFLPLTEALRPLGPAVLDRCPPYVRAELTRLLPTWGTAAEAIAPGPVQGWERGRLFAALCDLVVALTAERPCALLVEDVHWADATTLDFLSYLTVDGAIRLVMTCREEDADAKRDQWFAEVARQTAVVRLALGRLSYPEVAEQVGGLLGAAAPAPFVDEVFRRAEGNAFFTEQLVVAGTRDEAAPQRGVGLPSALAQLLISRVETVGDDGREVLTALAVAGRGLDDTLLASITGLIGRRLSAAVRELVDARLIDRPGPDGRYRLRHALVGEAIAADLLAGDRRERHAAVARGLTAHAAADGPGEVAEHWAAAGETTAEMPWRLAAATDAERIYAHREAATHWERLIALWPRVPAATRPAGADLITSYLNALAALDRCGDTKRALPLAEEAVRTLPPETDPRRRALLYERMGFYRELDENGAGLAAFDVAMQLLTDFPVRMEHAVVFLSYGGALWELGRDDDARHYLDQAFDACRSEVPVSSEVSNLCLLAWLLLDAGDVDAGSAKLGEIEAMLERHERHPATPWVAQERAETLLVLGRLEESAASARSAIDAAHRDGLDQAAVTQLLRCDLFEALAELGRHAEAEAVILAATDGVPTSGASYDHMIRAILDMLSGDVAAASARWAAVEAVTHPKNLFYGGNLVDRGGIDLWAHRPREALSRILHSLPKVDDGEYRRFTAAILTTAMRACADIAETARAQHDPAADRLAQHSVQELRRAHQALKRDPFAAHPFYATAAAEGATWNAELTRVAGASDPGAWTLLNRPHRVAYAQWRQAEALLIAGHRSPARDCLREAAQAAHNHAPLLTEIRSLARLARLDVLAPVVTEREQPVAYGLTPRETAVLNLIAEGLTNTQIGARLFMSNKTASVHVTHILTKLGATNRAQAAAIAQRAGLVAPDPSH
ncbi:AAA family ATPase [Actinoplanes sp. TBRC 11911]|uniref:helix-turn-helix transcriptional regulator n=1 Tax=Actinoplanes sp. TBRC 11911 TaxID=2729386 RepID=UPI00145D2EB1|nr:AAA family ATPase [Actinoplanes sp. TBRC 11911]NMO54701.1 AAA family ATPase [Actinoplanes sp. TBRC 11911]